jgi:stage III sporulation protein AH
MIRWRPKRNQVIIAALVAMIAVAGYLNYIDRAPKGDAPEIAVNGDGEITALVMDEGTWQEMAVVDTGSFSENDSVDIALTYNEDGGAGADPSAEPGAAVFVNSSNDSSYFLQAKLNREQARSNERQMLTDIINNQNVDKDKKAESASALLTIQERIEKETAAEALIESKGFSEVYVRIDDATVDVVVNKAELSEAEIAQIEDIVKRKTGYTVEQIHINPFKK